LKIAQDGFASLSSIPAHGTKVSSPNECREITMRSRTVQRVSRVEADSEDNMVRMQHPAPARKVMGSALAGALTTIVVYVLNTYVLETPLPGEVAAAVATVVAFAVGYLLPPSERDQIRDYLNDRNAGDRMMCWRLTKKWLAGALLLTAACTRPDVTAEIAAADTLLTQIDTDLRPALTVAAAAELRAAEMALMMSNQQVVSLEGPCDLGLMEVEVVARLDCRLETAANLPATPNATTTLEILTTLRGYLAGLNALATSKSPAAIQTNAAALTAALSEEGADRIAAFRSLAAVFENRDQALAETLGFVARQRQAAGLRRAIQTAHPLIEELVEGAVAYFRTASTEIDVRHNDLLIASDRVADARIIANPAENRRATDALRAAYAAYRSAEAASPIADLIAFRDLHGALRDRITGATSLDEILALVTELQTVLDAIEGGTQ
jgi:hypothetical protein